MRKFVILIIFFFFVMSVMSFSFAEPDSPHIRYWILCGPFKNAKLDTECVENEAAFSPIAGQVVDGKRCRKYLSSQDKITLDLEEIFGPLQNVVSYAYVEVYSHSEKKVKLCLGSDNGIKAWLNGKNIHTNDIGRDFVYDEDKIDVKLKSGWNSLLLKIHNRKALWQFSARFIARGSAKGNDLEYHPPMMIQLPVEEVKVSSVQESKKNEYSAKKAIDKDRWTRWSSEFNDPQWIVLDLGSSKPVKKILLNWESYAKNYSIQFSNDYTGWMRVYSTDTGDGGQDVINLIKPIDAQYIRLNCTQRGTRFGYSLWEFQVFK